MKRTSQIFSMMLLITVTIPQSASAQDSNHQLTDPAPETALRYQPFNAQHEEALKDAKRRIRNGRIGIGLSLPIITGGAFMVAAGSVSRNLDLFGTDLPTSAGEKALIATGTISIVGGIVGVIVGAGVLAGAKHRKRELDRRRPPPDLRLGAGSASLKLAF